MTKTKAGFLTQEEIEICNRIKPLSRLNGTVGWGMGCAFFRKGKTMKDVYKIRDNKLN